MNLCLTDPSANVGEFFTGLKCCDLFYLFLPLVLGLFFASAFGVGNMDEHSLFKESHGSAFGLIWVVLYLFIGISWLLCRDNLVANVLIILLIVLLIVWMGAVRMDKFKGVPILGITAMFTLATAVYCSTVHPMAGFLLTLLSGFLLVAMAANAADATYSAVSKAISVKLNEIDPDKILKDIENYVDKDIKSFVSELRTRVKGMNFDKAMDYARTNFKDTMVKDLSVLAKDRIGNVNLSDAMRQVKNALI